MSMFRALVPLSKGIQMARTTVKDNLGHIVRKVEELLLELI